MRTVSAKVTMRSELIKKRRKKNRSAISAETGFVQVMQRAAYLVKQTVKL